MAKFNYRELIPLVRKVKKGDKDAFSQLYSRTYQKVYFFALSLTKNEQNAQDVVQETFITVLKSIQQLENDSLFVAWMNKIAYNASMKIMGQNTDDSLDDDEANLQIPDPNPESDPLTVSMRNDEKRRIVECIEKLPVKLRAAVVLKYYEGLKEKEIAEALGCPVGTVKSRLNSAKEELKQMLSEED